MTNHAFYSKTLPDPFLREDGSRVAEPSQWPEQAAYIRRLAQDCLYGQWPGKPQSLKASRVGSEIRYDGSLARLTEKVELTVNDDFMMEVEIRRPLLPRKIPAIVYNVSPAWMRVPNEDEITAAGYAIVLFNREAIAPDLEIAKATGHLEEAQSRKYPTLSCGEIMAWGWGHSLVADYLETCDWAGEMICTGHSRGGKAALCAGVMDDRFAVVAPIGSGCGGAGSARYLGTLDGSRQDPDKCETIGRMAHAFPKWMGPRNLAAKRCLSPWARKPIVCRWTRTCCARPARPERCSLPRALRITGATCSARSCAGRRRSRCSISLACRSATVSMRARAGTIFLRRTGAR